MLTPWLNCNQHSRMNLKEQSRLMISNSSNSQAPRRAYKFIYRNNRNFIKWSILYRPASNWLLLSQNTRNKKTLNSSSKGAEIRIQQSFDADHHFMHILSLLLKPFDCLDYADRARVSCWKMDQSVGSTTRYCQTQ